MLQKIFKRLNQYAVDIPTFPVNQCHIQFLGECLAVLWECRAAKVGGHAFGTHGVSGNVVANPAASSSAPFPQELNPWGSHKSEPIHSSQAGKNQNQTPVQDQRCLSGPSARKSVIPSEGDSWKNCRADQQTIADLRSSFSQFHHASNICLLEDKNQDWGMYLFTFMEAMLWSKKWRSLNQWMIQNLRVLSEELMDQTIEVLDAEIASTLNRIIQNVRFKKKVSLEEMKTCQNHGQVSHNLLCWKKPFPTDICGPGRD